MDLIDTHTHLYAESFEADRDEMIERAKAAGVKACYLPNIDSNSIAGMLALEAKYPGYCLPMMGLHPCSVKEDFEKELAIVHQWLEKRSFAAIGEIGIDLYWDKTFFEQQQRAFIQQAEWAVVYDLPIVIHSRESIDILINLVRQMNEPRLKGIFHCFSGTVEQAEAIIDLGFLLGIGGVLTFKKGGLAEIIEHIDLDYLVLETDAPYLAPHPYRGKRNESAYTKIVAEKLAELKKKSIAEIASKTTKNASNLFRSLD
ncbi:MAG: TatD family hydrolase [Saprospiraceae bacterium]